MLKLILLIFVLTICGEVLSKPAIEVELDNSVNVLGSSGKTLWTEQKYYIFHDIRYAKAPLSSQRFRLSERLQYNENEVIDAETKVNSCPSIDTVEKEETVSEDCLFLTVSTKNVSGKYPVMVHLSGYDIIYRENTNDDSHPGYLLEQDVVLVSVQYRVGVLGFLSTDSAEIPGNAGIYDVINALYWVGQHIEHFGGDKNSVTIFGQHHSAAIINLLTMTTYIDEGNLFHKVIYQSGSALLPNLINTEPMEMAKQIAKELNCVGEDKSDINMCLKDADVQDLIKAYHEYAKKLKGLPKLIVPSDSFGILKNKPKEYFKKRKYRPYPAMGGVVQQPSTCLYESLATKQPEYGTLFDTTVSKRVAKKDDSSDKTEKKKAKKEDLSFGEIANEVREALILEISSSPEQTEFIHNLFPKKVFVANLFKNIAPTLIDMQSIPVKAATFKALEFNAMRGGKSYLYAFNFSPFESRLSCDHNFAVTQLTDDDMFLFPQFDGDDVKELDKGHLRIARLMVEMWTSFAATGKPDAHSLSEWPPMQKYLDGPYFIIDTIHKFGFNYTQEYYSGLTAQKNNIDILNV